MKTLRIILLGLLVYLTIMTNAQNNSEKISSVNLIEKALNESGIESAKSKFSLIKTDTSSYYFSENEFINLGYTLLNNSNKPEALVILQMAEEIFSNSPNILIFLATAYYQNNNTTQSIEIFDRRNKLLSDIQLKQYISENKKEILSTADEVIEKNIEARGGEAALKNVETLKITYSMQPNEGKETELIRMYKRPNLYRQGDGDNSFSSTNGNKTWNFNGTEWKEINTIYRTASIDDYTINYTEQGINYEFIGLEILNHIPFYHLTRTFSDGFKQDLYISAESFLLQEIKSDYFEKFPFMESYFTYWNYREIEGIKLPYVFIRNIGQLGPPHGGVIKDVQVNIPLEDSLFLPPDCR